MKSFAKQFNCYSSILIVLFILAFMITGCTQPNQAPTRNPGSAASLLANSLKATNAAGSYRFKGTGAIQYMEVNDRGTFTISGDYKNPGQSRLKLAMALGHANYYTETIHQNHVFYSMDQEQWKMTPADPNTLLQPAYKPVNFILEQLQLAALRPTLSDDVTINGQTLHVITAKSNQKKLKSLIEKDFAGVISLEPERKQGMQNFLKSLTVIQDYKVYVDSVTNRITRIEFSQNVKLGQQKSQKESRLSIDYTLYDFGAEVTIK